MTTPSPVTPPSPSPERTLRLLDLLGATPSPDGNLPTLDAKKEKWEPVPPKAQSNYSEYERNSADHSLRLAKGKTVPSGNDYTGFTLTICKGDATAGNRLKVNATATDQHDQFTPANIRSLTKGRYENGRHYRFFNPEWVVLDQEREAGTLCLYGGDRGALKKIAEALDDSFFSRKFDVRWTGSKCEDILNEDGTDPLNSARCEALITTLNANLDRKSWWDRLTEHLNGGVGFTIAGVAATLTGVLLNNFLKKRKEEKEKKNNNDQKPPSPPAASSPTPVTSVSPAQGLAETPSVEGDVLRVTTNVYAQASLKHPKAVQGEKAIALRSEQPWYAPLSNSLRSLGHFLGINSSPVVTGAQGASAIAPVSSPVTVIAR